MLNCRTLIVQINAVSKSLIPGDIKSRGNAGRKRPTDALDKIDACRSGVSVRILDMQAHATKYHEIYLSYDCTLENFFEEIKNLKI